MTKLQTTALMVMAVGLLVVGTSVGLLGMHIGKLNAKITVLEIQNDVDTEGDTGLELQLADLATKVSIVEDNWPWPEHFSPCGPLYCEHMNDYWDQKKGAER